MASLTDPLGKQKGSTGNGIAVYSFENGRIAPERFMPLAPRTKIPAGKKRRSEFKDVTYPAGLSVGWSGGEERLLVANNNSDEAVLLNASDGKIIYRFDLSTMKRIPASLPYTTVMTKDGKRGFVSLWNASSVAELDLVSGRVLADHSAAQASVTARRRVASDGAASESRQLAAVCGAYKSRRNRGAGYWLRKSRFLFFHETSRTKIWRQRSGIPGPLAGRKDAFFGGRHFRFRGRV